MLPEADFTKSNDWKPDYCLSMNKSLTTLMSKLNSQRHELDSNLSAAQHKRQELVYQIQQIEEQINQTGPNSLTINPAIEINRLNFITQQQEKKEAATRELKNNQEIENKLKEKSKRVAMELKMLAHYLEREESNQKEDSELTLPA